MTSNHSNELPVVSRGSKSIQIDTMEPTRFGMLKKFSFIVRCFFLWLYERVVHETSQVQDVLSIPQDESIVYLLSTENKHDFLFLNDLCLKTGMPLAYTSNGRSTLRYSTLGRRFVGLFSHSKKKATPDELALAVVERRPILLYLNQFGLHERENRQITEETLDNIVKAAQTHQIRVHFIPVGVIWERRAETYRHSKFNELYGTPTRPTSVRRFLSVMPGVIQLFFQIGKPLCLIHHEILDLNKEYHGKELRLSLNDDIDRMHTQVNGPKVKPHQLLLREIIESDAFQMELKSISQSTGQSQEELVKEAHKILEKSASKFSLLMCKLFTTFFTPMWSFIYNGLYYDTEKFNEIRELSKTNRLVFIPSHKSHIDYLVLSILLFQHGVLPPHIAAGDNLNFFLVGSLLRRGGAFFIKRSFRGELLYTACIRYYIAKILEEGYPVEFFIEGGRSRTGQVLQPKFGILRMVAQAIQANPSMPVKIIPCAITYEKVIEDMGYKNEQAGGKKEKESFTHLIKTTKLLISKYGQIYVSFSDPIDLNQSLEILPDKPPVTEQQLTANIDKMAAELMMRINRSSTITISSLLSCALLNSRENKVLVDKLLDEAAFLLSLLIERRAQITPVLQTALAASRAALLPAGNSEEMPAINGQNMHGVDLQILASRLSEPISETIRLFKQNGTVKSRGGEVQVAPSDRLQLAFYKNIMLFALLDDIYLASSILSLSEEKRTKPELRHRFGLLMDLFSIEFSPVPIDEAFEQAVEWFRRRGWITLNDDEVHVEENAVIYLKKLWFCIAHHIDSYHFVFNHFSSLKEVIEEAKFNTNLLNLSKTPESDEMYLPESRSKVIYAHAIQKLQNIHCFEVFYEQGGRKSVKMLKKSANVPDEIMDLLQSLKLN